MGDNSSGNGWDFVNCNHFKPSIPVQVDFALLQITQLGENVSGNAKYIVRFLPLVYPEKI